ncbi:MAG: hypothetical protein GC182_14555 [Rhodopseudomonas sp.]|nr:hypothetical protein [Rhodopseudomonas sp.]
MALTFGAAATPAHCLTETTQTFGSGHVHHNKADRDHPDTGDIDHDHASKCCGLFAVNGVMPNLDLIVERRPPESQIPRLFAADLAGQDTDRIDRPPRSLPSL